MASILLIDDDEHLGAPLAQYFQRFGLRLVQALTPSDGLAQLRPRDRLGFIPVTGPEAVAMARSRAGVIARFLEGIDRLASPG